MAPFIDQDSTSSCTGVSSETPLHTTNVERCTDKFLYYSNDDIRIKTLKMDEDSRAIKKEGIANMVPTELRKTRLSFELHPDVIMEKELTELGLYEDLAEDLADLVIEDEDLIKGILELGEMDDLFDDILEIYEPKSVRK